MAFPNDIYAPAGVYTKTNFENPAQGLLAGLKIPVFIGPGNEVLTQTELEVVRGSSATVDQKIVSEDLDGRAVVSVSDAGAVTLGAFDGVLTKVQVRNFPIVKGNGTGSTATSTAAVSVKLNGDPIVVLAIAGLTGTLTLASAPEAGDTVRVTYYFNRTDTQVTDDVSDQITEDAATLRGAVAQSYVITEDENDEFIITVDGTAYTVTLTATTSGWSASQTATQIESGTSGSTLAATTYITNQGTTAIILTADESLVMGAGSANSTLGFSSGDDSARTKTFYTFNGPIVDGTNGGVTTTDPSDVTVKVDGVPVIPTAVDGTTRAVTLAQPPKSSATVTIKYYFNTWQDTFDYLAHTGITAVTACGVAPRRNDFIDEADFVLQDDRIYWGTAVMVSAGTATSGSTAFDDSQITTTLVDTRGYLEPCAAVTDTSVSPPVTSTTKFTLPLTPTTGNGRNSPLGTSLFQTVANDRIDLPTNRPDLVIAYWGFGVQDAIERGAVTVLSVDSDTAAITLASSVPVGASVFATFYYNTLVDQEYTVAVETAGAAGVGSYSVTNEAEDSVLTPQFGAKSSGLATITLAFPSGSERTPDVRFEAPSDTDNYEAPVEEDVTVTFSALDSTLAKDTVPGAGPFYTVENASDHARITVNAAALASGSAGVDVSNHVAVADLGFFASHLGTEVAYEADTGLTTYEIDATNSGLNLTVDGVFLSAIAITSATATLAAYVTAINRAASGETETADGGGATTLTLDTSTSVDEDDYYVGWTLLLTNNSPVGVQDLTADITAYDGTTSIATVDATWSTTPDNTTTYRIYNADYLPAYAGATKFVGSTVIASAEFDKLTFHYTGDVAGASADIEATVAAATYASATTLAAAVKTAIDTAITGAALAAAFDHMTILVEANQDGQLVFKLLRATGDLSGYLEFVTHATAAQDFGTLAGLSSSDVTAESQVKLVDGPIARRFTITGDNTSGLAHDRLILRNRIMTGDGTDADSLTFSAISAEDQSYIKVEAGTGNTLAGLSTGDIAWGGQKATVRPATLVGAVGFGGGQSAAGEPVVTFYAAGGTTAQNNVFKVTFDGTPVTVEFTDSSGVAIASGASADVPLGPATTANTIINQIAAALATAGLASTATVAISSGLVNQEGAGYRLTSGQTDTSSALVIGTGSANGSIGMTDGATADRTPVLASVLASALMGHTSSTVALSVNTWDVPVDSYFAYEALAGVVTDASNAEYLYLQGQGVDGLGTLSSLAWAAPTTDSVLLNGTGLLAEVGDGSAGEAGISGFYVTSSDTADGSGTADVSLLNSGTGQDGTVGQTYHDLVTGLTFTLLEREGGSNYPAAETFTFTVRAEVTTDSNLPVNTLPGVEMIVTNTTGTTSSDTALVESFERGGEQPGISDVYYVSYEYSKQDFSTRLYTKFASIEAQYGTLSPDNPVTLATFLAMTNGAVLVGVNQVQKATDSPDGTVAAYMTAVDELAQPLSGGITPDILVPLRGDSEDLFIYMSKHADIQSSIRYRSERTVMGGLVAGTQIRAAGEMATAIAAERVRLVYPDMVLVTLTDASNRDEQHLVSGPFLASGLAGSVVATNVDVATPWTKRKLINYDQLGRTLDAVEKNTVAQNGITVIEDRPPVLSVRHGFTTDMSSILTKTPTVTLIADEVQQQSRGTLERFIGIKFLPGILSQIEGQLSNTLKQLVAAEIITTYTGVSANVATDDPTVAEVEAWYQPVFPLLYIVITFNLRSSL